MPHQIAYTSWKYELTQSHVVYLLFVDIYRQQYFLYLVFSPKKSINDKEDFLGFYVLLDIPKNTIKLQYKCEVEMGSYFDSNIFSIQRE